MTICPHCNNSTWKLEGITPTGAAYKYFAIQCSRCNKPVSVVEFTNIGAETQHLGKSLKDVQSMLATINENIRRLFEAQRAALR